MKLEAGAAGELFAGAAAAGLGAFCSPVGFGALGALLPLGFAGEARGGTVRLCLGASGSTNGPFCPQASSSPPKATITVPRCKHFIVLSIPAAGGPGLIGTNKGRFRSDLKLIQMEKVMKRISKALGAVLAIAACGVSTAAMADNSWGVPNPLGFYLGAGVGESKFPRALIRELDEARVAVAHRRADFMPAEP